MGRKTREKNSPPRPLPKAPAPSLLPPRAWLWLLGLGAAAALAYAGGLGTPFLLDDPINITKNPDLPRPLNFYRLAADPRAVVTASLHWNYSLGGFTVTGYHVLNLLAHVATAFLVFVLAWTTFRLPSLAVRHASRAEALAGVVALIFLLHPVQTESVTYVIQRAEIFVGAALLAAMLSMTAMQEAATPRALAVLAASCVFGMYSKPSFVVVPALLLVQDFCFLSRGDLRRIRARWPAYLVATTAAVATFALSKLSGSLEGDTAGFDVQGISPLDYLSAQFGVVVQYFRVALWPSRLCFDCGYRGAWPVHSTFLGESVVLPLILLVVAGVAALAAWKRRPLLSFAFLATVVALAPTSSFLPLADFYVEHRMYLPIAFLAMAVVPAADDAIAAACARFPVAAPASSAVRGVTAGVVVVMLSILTMSRNALLANPVALMEDAIAQAPQNERVQYNLANAYKRLGRLDDAIPHYQAAIQLLPDVMRSYENLGSVYLEQGKLEDALKTFLAGAEARPDAGMTHRNVANAYLALGQPGEALTAARRSLEVEPGNANGYRLMGDALSRMGRAGEAMETWRAGLAANPRDSGLSERVGGRGKR